MFKSCREDVRMSELDLCRINSLRDAQGRTDRLEDDSPADLSMTSRKVATQREDTFMELLCFCKLLEG
ncbi:unnamed protein product [Calypogeia fissa]